MTTNARISPDRYLSTNGGDWRVIGSGGSPECRDGTLDEALFAFRRFDTKTPRAAIPVWNGDARCFSTLAEVAS